MPSSELRPALYHRLHRLLPVVAHPLAHRAWRVALWSAVLLYFAFVALVLALRYAVLPDIERYRPDIERLASRGLGQAVTIGRIEASWDGLHPDLALLDVRVADAEGRPALAFSRVQTVLSWWSLPALQLRLRLLAIEEPTLHLRRDARGDFFIAGIPLDTAGSDSGVSDWVLAQQRIRIRSATLVWEDDRRGAPPLVLEDVGFALDNDGRNHRFGLSALPPPALAARLDIRGDFRGRDLETLESWKGRLYAAIDYADLAVWRQWVDYPLALPHGRGALRGWLEFAEGGLRGMTADLALEDVRLRLSPRLPALELDYMRGRLAARLSGQGWQVSGQRVELATRPLSAPMDDTGPAGEATAAIRVDPTDFEVDWQPEPATAGAAAGSGRVRGSASASRLDLGALSALAAHLPFDANTRRLLAEFAPRGAVSALRASWFGDAEALQSYTLKARFDDLALRAQGRFPGFSGFSGTLEASEAGGSATLRSDKATLDLPGVFPEPGPIVLDSLDALARWKQADGVLDVELARLDFAGPDAAGAAHGSYRLSGEGPGSIDLVATLKRATGTAVWRYMPHTVNRNARYWLRDALTAGTASDAKLVLKGDLAHFPFVGGQHGQFLVTARARGVTLDYAPGWPRITGIDGDLRFEGPGMLVEAQRGSILGVQLSQTRAEIPDFDAAIPVLAVRGRAEGATEGFLRFVEQSPVAERIDRFTEGMQAAGNGRLDLALSIPLELAKIDQSTVQGTYRFLSNDILIEPDLPPFRQVNGTLEFTASELRIPEIAATLFGGPLRIKGVSQPGGKVLITANGSLGVDALRRQFDLPLLDHLSGSVGYRGEVRVVRRSADLSIESSLVGLSSSLPAPFNKSALAALPLRLERTLLPGAAARDELRFTLAEVLQGRLIRRQGPQGFAVERGSLAVGLPLQLPEQGVAVAVAAPAIDLDFWRRALRPPANGGTATAAPAPALESVRIRTDALRAFGRQLHDVDLSAHERSGSWQAQLTSREAAGTLRWDAAGKGKLAARLQHLRIDADESSGGEGGADETEELPALDIVAEDFALGERRLGRLELQARNEARTWRLERFALANPHGTLSGSGEWRVAGGKRTQLDFRIDSSDVGKLLERFGHPGAVRGASAHAEGRVGWNASPVDLDYATLSGEVTLNVGKGQFVKLDPGAGKLLGLISLQSLPRRITLDFRDVFSEGFAFDSIAGTLSLQNGVMRTDRLLIDGPAARVVMRGETDLRRETQNLTVNVQPEVGGTAALGVALANPMVGVAALLAHKILQNPLNQMFGFDYLVTGTWDDPRVEKLNRGTSPANPRLPDAAPANLPSGAENDVTPQ